MDQEAMFKASMIEKQIQESTQNLEIIESQIEELNIFKDGLSSLVDSKGKEIIASIGKGVHLKAEIKDSNLFVEVGSGTVVKKTPEETQKTIESQIRKLTEAKIHLTAQIESYTQEIMQIVQEIEKQNKENPQTPK